MARIIEGKEGMEVKGVRKVEEVVLRDRTGAASSATTKRRAGEVGALRRPDDC